MSVDHDTLVSKRPGSRASLNGLAVLLATVPLAGMGLGCEGSPSPLGVDVASSGAAPFGSDAVPTGNTIPTTMHPGERIRVQVTMQNAGSQLDGTNAWDGSYALYRSNSLWSWVYARVEGAVNPTESQVFDFVLTAPAAGGTYDFRAQMRILGDNPPFGTAALVSDIDVDEVNQARWACSWDQANSTFSTTMLPGETQYAVLRLTNPGSATWEPGAGSSTCLHSRDDPTSFWGASSRCVYLADPVANGEFVDLVVPIEAPSTPGVYPFTAQLRDFRSTGVGFFSAAPCVAANITVSGTPALDASLVSEDFPELMAPGESRTVHVTMQNDGTASWPVSRVGLFSRMLPRSLVGVTRSMVAAQVDPGNPHTFVFAVRAPSAPGAYAYRFLMRDILGANGGYFGPLVEVPFIVDGAAQPELAATVESQNIPARMTAGGEATFTVTMRNTGTSSWDAASFRLRSTQDPSTLWGLNFVPLAPAETVGPNETHAFSFVARAPAVTGTYGSRWRMFGTPYVGFFGAEAVVASIEVTSCGNGVTEGGEACDDGNLVSGDGCSSTCTPETRKIDLGGDPVAKTFFGSEDSGELASVAIGDLNDDGANELLVGEIADVTPSGGGGVRTAAGQVIGYLPSVGSFLDQGSLTVPSGAAFTVVGAEANDHLSAIAGNKILVGDVTGDGAGDLVVAAVDADGFSNARAGSGEVYVIYGGAALLTAGEIDLADAPPAGGADPLIAARIVGANAGDGLRVLALGDVTGDGTDDLILGAPNDDAGGADAGAIWVVEGGSDLVAASAVDLASPPGTLSVVKILGSAAGDRLGMVGAVGALGGDAAADLVVSSPTHQVGLLSSAGAAWALFGPIVSGTTLAGADLTWVGQDENEELGSSLAIGHVVGSVDHDVVIGSGQFRQLDDLPYGSIDVWEGPFLSGTDFDLGTDIPAGRIIASKFYDRLGQSLAMGDYNNDGFLDIAGCASGGDGPDDARFDAGEIRLVLGGPSLGATYDLAGKPPRMSVYGARSGDELGAEVSVVAMGDLDGDGLSDVCAGSPSGGTGGTSEGRVDCILAE
ncbi:MAG: FG-GAP repeat protein [Deltaproteobacteria bacterium]|nr:FG-GAP repeat protein [Deltaproteobacteria bacterium]